MLWLLLACASPTTAPADPDSGATTSVATPTVPSGSLCAPNDVTGVIASSGACVPVGTLGDACADGFSSLAPGPCPTFAAAVAASGWLDGTSSTTWSSTVEVERCTWASGAVRDRIVASYVVSTDAGSIATLLFQDGALVGAHDWRVGPVQPWCCSGYPADRLVVGEDPGDPASCVAYDPEAF